MGLQAAMFSSVSGLDITSTAIEVAGDNIANVNTPGFKERRAEFANVLGQSITSVGGFSQLGAGAKVARVATVFSQGTFESTGRGSDLAIEGGGFFMVDSTQGRFYTRAGIFAPDSNGFLVTPEGMQLQGFGIDPTTSTSNGQLAPIQLATSIAPPRETGDIELSLNLDASETAIPAGFDPSQPNLSSNYRTVVTTYDTQGSPHPATIFFTKVADNSWHANVTLPKDDTFLAPANPADDIVLQDPGNMPIVLSFDNDGVMTSPTGLSPVAFSFSGLAGNPTQSIDMSFGNLPANASTVDATTQFQVNSTTNAFAQDGFAAGTLQSIAFDDNGMISGQYSNGESLNLAVLALATFPNVEGMTLVGNNRLQESRGSGQPLVGEPKSGTFGSIRSSAIEQSNVDLAAQFVKLIINQRAFQANTRTVSVTNELLANLNSLGQ